MYNIQKAVSRLDFAPKLTEIKITDIKRGLGEFTPKPDKTASFANLKAALKKAGYTLGSAEVTVQGTLIKGDSGWWIEADVSKQRFAIGGEDLSRIMPDAVAGARVELTGDWQTVSQGGKAREVVRPKTAVKMASALPLDRGSYNVVEASLNHGPLVFADADPSTTLAPIRTTSPGLTVYRGGAFIPRYSYTRQHLGDLKVDRQGIRLDFSYTPTPTLQLEAEIPYQRSSFESRGGSGSGSGFGNLTLWGKYRFFRTLETWGDKQASVRLGVELPTGKKSSPGSNRLDAPEFVRQQLSPISGGLALRTDLAYSQARNRFIYGANVEGVVRGERDGFRTGHEVRVNTDFEYVLFPLKYQKPGREVFAILETTYLHQGRGRLNGRQLRGSTASEFYLAPGLQFAVAPRFVIDASYQFPVVRNTGPLALRTDRNFLFGVRYLY